MRYDNIRYRIRIAVRPFGDFFDRKWRVYVVVYLVTLATVLARLDCTISILYVIGASSEPLTVNLFP